MHDTAKSGLQQSRHVSQCMMHHGINILYNRYRVIKRILLPITCLDVSHTRTRGSYTKVVGHPNLVYGYNSLPFMRVVSQARIDKVLMKLGTQPSSSSCPAFMFICNHISQTSQCMSLPMYESPFVVLKYTNDRLRVTI